jgi:hypothetical protein
MYINGDHSMRRSRYRYWQKTFSSFWGFFFLFFFEDIFSLQVWTGPFDTQRKRVCDSEERSSSFYCVSLWHTKKTKGGTPDLGLRGICVCVREREREALLTCALMFQRYMRGLADVVLILLRVSLTHKENMSRFFEDNRPYNLGYTT